MQVNYAEININMMWRS